MTWDWEITQRKTGDQGALVTSGKAVDIADVRKIRKSLARMIKMIRIGRVVAKEEIMAEGEEPIRGERRGEKGMVITNQFLPI